ncbi:MAG: RsmD family RNA methyltransferase [Geminicoccaceae bacterium]|nr:RsmD family RNA methyltransferase [Geminicoccaceae bacterium]MCX8100890.1 RsmD family RNA methyltransferase [Geminicoccaceae bacterium]MDW8369882.1 RsmD family RNA methyltransferase [Geminicoccaceae bacterium]
MSARLPRARPAAPRLLDVRIERLAAAGDGEALLDGRRLFVPLALPGERWRVRLLSETRDALRAEPVERLEGPPRATPLCPHFGTCGGCSLQHLPAEDYAAFKRARIQEPLERARLEVGSLLPLVSAPPASRRRLRLAFVRDRGGLLLGLRGRRSRAVVAIDRCPIALPELEALLAPLRRELAGIELLRRARAGELQLTAFAQGVELVLLATASADREDRERLAALAERLDLARLALAPEAGGEAEPITVRRAPSLRWGRFVLEPPPGAFMQATAAGERALQDAVAAWVPAGARLVDLFAGSGALSLPIADRLARLFLVEREGAVVEALARAVAGCGRIAVRARDLERAPLDARELAGFDAVLLDPPRGGAAAQATALARSTVGLVVYASCSPATFARDARILVDAGFRIEALQPIDQFLFSAEIELVALLRRGHAPRPLPA